MFNGNKLIKKSDRSANGAGEDQDACRTAVDAVRKAARLNKAAVEKAMQELQQRRQEAAAP